MPEIMIEQNQNIINSINMLNLPYSEALRNHMVNMVSGIITTEGNKNVSRIYSKHTCITGIEAVVQDFSENISGITNMWTTRELVIL